MTSLPPTEFKLADETARAVIRNNLDETLFVEASAGTGKTTSLVDRVVNLVASGRTTLDRLAAITFTESAAAELRDRIRQQLERAAEDESLGEAERGRCRQGVEDLDHASIRTLHAFAAQLLHERPLEAKLPPGFETTDEIAAGIKFNEAWNDWLDQALGEASPLATPLSITFTLGMRLDQLKETALEFHRNYTDLADIRFDSPEPAPTSVMRTLAEQAQELERLCEYSRLGFGDRLYTHVQSKLPALRRLAEAPEESPAAYNLVRRMLSLNTRLGRQSDWDRDPVTDQNACAALKDLLRDLDGAANDHLQRARRESLLPILEALRQFALEYAEQRRAEGRAEFHDLLVWARDLLRDKEEVRDHFRGRFSHLLIDEAQDTDPIQTEIAVFLAESPAGLETDAPPPTSWRQIIPEPGKLFVVGDPKQSIYRFRRADVAQMVQLQERMEESGGSKVSLVQNFRSQERLVNWVNYVFDRWMKDGQAGDGDPGYQQAGYEEMYPRWKGDTGGPHSPQVWALSNDASGKTIGPVRQQESAEIATLLDQIVTRQWPVLDEEATAESDEEVYRPARYSDICILMPRRTGLATLERGLETRDVPFRLESASLIFETQETRDLLNCLKAIDNPADHVAIVAALRSPAFGCSDVDLFQHYDGGGRFDYLADPARNPEGPVSEALGVLRFFHQDRLSGSTAALIDRFVRDRNLMEIAVGHPRMREQWRRYRFMVERAWQFESAGGNSLRAFVEWVEDQIREHARVTEAPVPESDEEAVRVMTIHAAKGLEFPIVILTGINSGRGGGPDKVLFDRHRGGVEVGLGSQKSRFSTEGFEAMAVSEKALDDAEAVRLMYVATTRARDHLVLSLRRTGTSDGQKSAAGRMAEIMEDDPDLWSEVALDGTPVPSDPGSSSDPDSLDLHDVSGAVLPHEHSVAAFEQWEADRNSLILAMGRPSSAAATSLRQSDDDSREDKPEQDSNEPWRIGRAGTGVGRAVHAVLQTVDLATGEGIPERASAQAAAENVPSYESDIAELCRVAVNSGVVKRAVASGRLWREVPVAVGMGGGSLHGFIDLLFEEHDGLVVVDYKTDRVRQDETAEAVQRYRLQGGAYAHAIQQLTGKPVKEAIFLYLRSHQEEPLPNLPQAMQEAQAAAAEVLGAPAG